MTLPTWATPFSDNVSTVSAAFLNGYVRTQIPKAVDGVGGGAYSPAVQLDIGGAGLKLSNGNALGYSSRSLSRVQAGLLHNTTAGTFGVGLIVVAANQFAVQMFDRIPNGATLTGITVYHNRTNLGTLPTTRVTATIRKRDITTGTGSVISGPTEDPTSVLASYEAHHSFSLSGLSEVIDNTTTVYYLDFSGESGSNTTSTVLYPCLVTFTLSAQDEAP
jgi:hypothetical protein